jgi:uncharacterized protein YodC (DUF2158 family)
MSYVGANIRVGNDQQIQNGGPKKTVQEEKKES